MSVTLSHKGHTSIRHENGDTVVRFHQTDIVRVNAERVILDNGGYFTATTKARMNQAAEEFGLEFVVYQKRGLWFAQRTLRSYDRAGSVEPILFPSDGRIEFPRRHDYSAKPIDVGEAKEVR